MIRIAGVSKTFSVKDNKVEALKNVSLDIAKGDIYGIIGMSGAGKSTLVRCLNFLERPTEVLFMWRDRIFLPWMQNSCDSCASMLHDLSEF